MSWRILQKASNALRILQLNKNKHHLKEKPNTPSTVSATERLPPIHTLMPMAKQMSQNYTDWLIKELVFPFKFQVDSNGCIIYQAMPKGRDNRKKNNNQVDVHKKDIIYECRNTTDIEVILKYTYEEDNDIRLEAVKQLCPCKVLRDIEVFWERVLELVDDEDVRIRSRILHIICDGSPERLEDRIYEALKEFNRDKDPQIRRTAHKVIASYEHTGKWNIL